jgi:UDP-N-acetylmuramoyl-tripeptide--D-alanyl-D-alanine ligase
MRMAIESLPKGITAFNDAYNANPTSMEASLRMFASLPGRKVAVLGDMLELGDDEARFHDEIAELAVRLRLDRVLLVGPRMSLALQGVDAGRVERAVDGTLLAGPLADWLRAGDRVLFKGSRGAKVERILQALSHALASSTEVS